jgi:hypothetical protein
MSDITVRLRRSAIANKIQWIKTIAISDRSHGWIHKSYSQFLPCFHCFLSKTMQRIAPFRSPPPANNPGHSSKDVLLIMAALVSRGCARYTKQLQLWRLPNHHEHRLPHCPQDLQLFQRVARRDSTKNSTCDYSSNW